MKSFPSLNHKQRVRQLHRLAQSALRAYDLPETKLTPLAFVNNAVFKVETTSIQANAPAYVLRIHRPNYSTSAEIRSELQYMQALKGEASVAVPEPVPTRQRDLITTVSLEGIDEPRCCNLLTWVDGHVCRPHLGLGLKGTYRLGEVLGQMHLFSQSFKPSPEFCLPRWDADSLFTEASPFKPGLLEAIFSPADHAIFEEVEQRTRAIFRTLEQESQAFASFIRERCRSWILTIVGGVIFCMICAHCWEI